MTLTDCPFQEWKVDEDSWPLQTVQTEKQNLSLYLDQSGERLSRFSKSERILSQYDVPVYIAKKLKKEERHKQWKEKQLRGKFIRETEEVSEETWGWIRKGCLKKETEVLIFEALEQALRTNWISKNIDVQEVSE